MGRCKISYLSLSERHFSHLCHIREAPDLMSPILASTIFCLPFLIQPKSHDKMRDMKRVDSWESYKLLVQVFATLIVNQNHMYSV